MAVASRDLGRAVASTAERSTASSSAARPEGQQQLRILKYVTGEYFSMPAAVSLDHPVVIVKKTISGVIGGHDPNMRISLNGVNLEDSRTLRSYGCQFGSLLIVKTEGGGGGKGPGDQPEGKGGWIRSCGSIRRAPNRIFEWQEGADDLRGGGAEVAPAVVPAGGGCLFLFDGLTGETLPLPNSVSLSLLVRQLKEMISCLVDAPYAQMQVSWNGTILHDSRTLLSYGVRRGQCLHLRRVQRAIDRTIDITVNCVDDAARPLIARLSLSPRISERVVDVKDRLADLTGVPVNDQRLTLAGHTLANDRRLCECDVTEDDIVLQLLCPFSAHREASVLERNSRLARANAAAIDRAEFPVMVREIAPPGRRRRCGLTADITVRRLKELVAGWSGVAADHQILLYRGRVLQDAYTANYYNLEGGACVELAVRGGAQPVRVALHAPEARARPQFDKQQYLTGKRRTKADPRKARLLYASARSMAAGAEAPPTALPPAPLTPRPAADLATPRSRAGGSV